MLKSGILNPAILQLLARVRHTNTLLIADRGFPSWRDVETVDLSLVDDIPTVLQVLDAMRFGFVMGRIYMAEEFRRSKPAATVDAFVTRFDGVEVTFEPHLRFKQRVPSVTGIIRTADTRPYSNLIVESA